MYKRKLFDKKIFRQFFDSQKSRVDNCFFYNAIGYDSSESLEHAGKFLDTGRCSNACPLCVDPSL